MTKFGTYMRIDLGMVPTKKNGPTYGPEGWTHWGHSSKRVLSWLAASNPSIGRKTQIAQCAAVGGLNQLGRLGGCLEN